VHVGGADTQNYFLRYINYSSYIVVNLIVIEYHCKLEKSFETQVTFSM